LQPLGRLYAERQEIFGRLDVTIIAADTLQSKLASEFALIVGTTVKRKINRGQMAIVASGCIWIVLA